MLVLGSGGPFVNPNRASSGFVVFEGGAPIALVDAGGGTFERLGQAGVSAAELDPLLVTHFHIDHSGGLAPVVFSAWMEGRTEPLRLVGPAPLGEQPGAARLVDSLFGEDGAWSYLHSFEGFGIEPIEIASESQGATVERVPIEAPTVSAVAVPHGMMPTLAYRIELSGGASVVFSGDVSEYHEPLAALAEGCDLLVCDFALPERETEHGGLHAKPSEVARLAERSECRRLLLTHVMPEFEDEVDEAVERVRDEYDGEVVLAEDLLRVPIA